MTKKLRELFNLQDSDDSVNTEDTEAENTFSVEFAEEVTTAALSNLEKIEHALPQIRGLEASDGELDELSDNAVSSYRDLMELGMQVDSRFSSEIFAVAGTMLGHAITAKNAKVNKKLKMIELQLKKAAIDQKQQIIDQKLAEDQSKVRATPLGTGQPLDRNELLKMFSSKQVNK